MERTDVAKALIKIARELTSGARVGLQTTEKEWREALKKDEADLRKYEADLKKIQRGESVENLTEEGAKSVIRSLKAVIKAKKEYFDSLAKTATAQSREARITKGKRFGDWVVTQYKPLWIDDLGTPNDGVIKLVNQETIDEVFINHDHAGRSPKWWTSYKNRNLESNSPEKLIKWLTKVSQKEAGF